MKQFCKVLSAPTGKLNGLLFHRGRGERWEQGRSQIDIFVRKVDPVRPIWPKIVTGKQLATRNKPAEVFL